MPHKGNKSKCKENQKAVRKDSNGEAPKARQEQDGAVGGEIQDENQPKLVNCCVPSGCENSNQINENEPGDAVRVACNNDQCGMSNWMHLECFTLWEDSVLSFLRSCGRARSWSEKQRLQNLWTKKGYDLAYKACDCMCGRGHLRKDLDYFPKPVQPAPVAVAKKKHKKGSNLPTLTVSSKGHHAPAVVNDNHKEHSKVSSSSNGCVHHEKNQASQPRERVGSIGSVSFRERVNSAGSVGSTQRDLSSPRDRAGSVGSHLPTSRPSMSIPAARNRHSSCQSMTSTGSSPPNSTESPSSSSPGTPCTPVFGRPSSSTRKSKFDFIPEPSLAVNGSIFRKRDSLNDLSCLPQHKRNPYHIKMDDDSPPNTDDTLSFIVSNLTAYQATSVNCLLCRNTMPVFDHYPLIDGTFFLSPVSYDEMVSFPVEVDNKSMYLHAVCIFCLEGAVRLLCHFCNQHWNGSTLVIGTMYSYDIFAAAACCEKRFTCKKCSAPVLGVFQNIHYFSEFSHKVQCPRCHSEDHHFVKPLQELYYAQSICN